MGNFSFTEREDRRVGERFADFKVSFRARRISRWGHILFVPFICRRRQLRAIFAYSPWCSLVEADGKLDIEIGIVSGVQPGQVVIGYRIRYFPLCYLCDQILRRDAVARHFVYLYAASQFIVQIDKPVVIFTGLYIYFFADEFCDVCYRFCFAIVPLYDYLMCNHFLSTINEAVFPFFGDGQVIGNQISFTG